MCEGWIWLGKKQEQSLACFLPLFPPLLSFFSDLFILYFAFKGQQPWNEAAGPKQPGQRRGAGLCVPGQAQPWAPGGWAEPQIPRILHQLEKHHLWNSAGILGNERIGSSTLNNTQMDLKQKELAS